MATHLRVKDRFIKKHGRCKSDRVKDRYTFNDLLLVSEKLCLISKINVC